jgi:plastocyanin
MAKPRSRGREALLFAAIVAVALVVMVLGSMALRSSNDVPMAQGSASSPSAVAQSSPSAEAQICASCWGDGSPDPQVTGAALVENGVQVLKVGLVEGYYQPNNFTVQAGVPVTVVFTGNAEGCLAEPEFPELGFKADMAGGTATVTLGALKPGEYSFTCSMGVNEGTITAE